MRARMSAVGILLLALLLPVTAGAATCFGMASGPTTFGTVVLAIETTAEGFYAVAGEVVGPCPSGATQSVPWAGVAHLTGSGAAHLSGSVPGTASCLPFFFNATLQPPAYTTGTGRVDVPSNGTGGAVTLSPAACPALPQVAR